MRINKLFLAVGNSQLEVGIIARCSAVALNKLLFDWRTQLLNFYLQLICLIMTETMPIIDVYHTRVMKFKPATYHISISVFEILHSYCILIKARSHWGQGMHAAIKAK